MRKNPKTTTRTKNPSTTRLTNLPTNPEMKSAPMTERPKIKKSELFLISSFLLVIFSLSLLNLIFHTDEAVSIKEFRTLQQFPKFAVEKYWKGAFTKEMDLYLSDQFFARPLALQTGKYFESMLGIGTLTVRSEGPPIYYDAEGNYCFTATYHDPAAIDTYAHAVEDCAKRHPNIRFYAMLAPSVSAYLPEKFAKYSANPKLGIDQIEAYFAASEWGIQDQPSAPGKVRTIPIYDALKELDPQTAFFRSDHHWNGAGSYAAYVAFCHAAGLTPLAKEELGSYELTGFLGSHFRMTRNENLEKHPDVLLAYKPAAEVVLHRFTLSQEEVAELSAAPPTESMPPEEMVAKLDPVAYAVDPKLMGKSPSYGIYLGGDYGLCIIESAANKGKGNILVFKDSMANAVAPLLADHYEKVYIVDPRHWYGSLTKFAEENDIDTVLFLHSVNGAMGHFPSFINSFWGD